MLILNEQDLRATLIARRRELGLSQSELAHRAGLSRETVSLYETGKGATSVTKLLKWCLALDLGLTVRPGSVRPVAEELSALFQEDE